MRARLLGAVATVTLALAASSLGTTAAAAPPTAPSTAEPAGAATAQQPCGPATARAAGERRTSPWRRGADTPRVTAADLRALAPQSERRAALRAAAALPDTVRTAVHVNLVRGTHRGEGNRGPAAAQRWIAILNAAYAGKQSQLGAVTRYSFRLASVRAPRNDRWYHAVGNSRADQQMRRTLHRGTASTLNAYVTSPGRRSGILGFARFPWQYAGTPKLDGITVNVEAMPGGSAGRYNAGDTLVHETGHWLGLFHTFQGGCSGSGDYVADTPAHSEPSFGCPRGRDTCRLDQQTDPIENFMNYSWDSCMNQFTQGQSDRMDLAYERYRYGR